MPLLTELIWQDVISIFLRSPQYDPTTPSLGCTGEIRGARTGLTKKVISTNGLTWPPVGIIYYRSDKNFLWNTAYHSADYSVLFPKLVQNDFECW